MAEVVAAAGWWMDLFVLLAGACVGSFLNVCIVRIPADESIAFPGSRCPSCRAPLGWRDNIPILSYLLLGGRCRQCRARISVQYPVVELAAAVLFWLLWNRFGWTPVTAVYMVATAGLLVGTGIDLKHYILPDRITLGGIAFGLAASALAPALHGAEGAVPALKASAIGAVTGWVLLWLVAVIGRLIFRKDAMGFGDVKLLAAVGALTGWPGVLFTVVVSSLAGSVIGLALIAFGGREWQSKIPYGPFLALGAQIWMLGGDRLVEAYLQWVAGPPV